MEELLSGAADYDINLFVVDVIKSFDTVDRGILDRVLSSLGCLFGSVMHALSITPMSGCGLSSLLDLASRGLVSGTFLRDAR